MCWSVHGDTDMWECYTCHRTETKATLSQRLFGPIAPSHCPVHGLQAVILDATRHDMFVGVTCTSASAGTFLSALRCGVYMADLDMSAITIDDSQYGPGVPVLLVPDDVSTAEQFPAEGLSASDEPTLPLAGQFVVESVDTEQAVEEARVSEEEEARIFDAVVEEARISDAVVPLGLV